jgi:dihydrofolate reductase
MMEAYWPTAAQQPNPTKHAVEHAAWYNKVNKIVISNTMQGKDSDKVQFVNNDNLHLITEAKRNSNILCFGSPGALHTLFANNLVDEIYLLVNPILLGKGIALFSGIEERRKLQLKGTKLFESIHVICLHYSRV